MNINFDFDHHGYHFPKAIQFDLKLRIRDLNKNRYYNFNEVLVLFTFLFGNY